MPTIAIKKCPRCGGQLCIDQVPEFSGCISCGFDPGQSSNGHPVYRDKWSEVVRDGRTLGWEPTCRKWNLGKTAKKRLKNDLRKKVGSDDSVLY